MESCGKLDPTNVSTSPAARMWGGDRRPCTRWWRVSTWRLHITPPRPTWEDAEFRYSLWGWSLLWSLKSSLLLCCSFLSTWAHLWWLHRHGPSFRYLSATFLHSSPHSLLSTHPLVVLWRKIKRRNEINWGQSCSFTCSAPGQETLLITRLKMLLLQTEKWVQAEFKWNN